MEDLFCMIPSLSVKSVPVMMFRTPIGKWLVFPLWSAECTLTTRDYNQGFI